MTAGDWFGVVPRRETRSRYVLPWTLVVALLLGSERGRSWLPPPPLATAAADAVSTLVAWLWFVALLVVVHVSLMLFNEELCVREQSHEWSVKRTHEDASSRRRRVGKIPPPFPNGWYFVTFSRDVGRGESASFSLLGKHIVVFRTHDNAVHALDAYCPHMGANLGGGEVTRDGCIECPFHGWRFSGATGECTGIAYSPAEPPPQSRVARHALLDINGTLMLWHHALGEPPSWQPRRFDEIDDGRLVLHGTGVHYVTAHVQEMPENGADVAHLNYLHAPSSFDLLSPLLEHRWNASWRPLDAPDAHLAEVTLRENWVWRGTTRVLSHGAIDVTVNQVGPGWVWLKFKLPFALGNLMLFELVTPHKPLLQKVHHMMFSESWMPRIVTKIVMRGMLTQFERDIPVWNNKMFTHPPMQVKGDGPLMAFRRWFAQFYSKDERGELVYPTQDENDKWAW